MIKSLYRYLVYLSLIFLLIVLFKIDYLIIPKNYSAVRLFVSILFLFSGFIFHAVSWQKILLKSKFPAELAASLASIGLSIFGKYIPGKVWMIMGRSTYVSIHSGFPLARLSVVSLNAQFITIWIGLLFGFSGIIALEGLNRLGAICIAAWLLLTVIIFTKIAQNILEAIAKKIFKKTFNFPTLTFSAALSIMPWFALYWALWSFGFYMFVSSLSSLSIPLVTALGFPLAGTLGIIMVIMPGGLVVREGIIAAYLNLIGFSLTEATGIAVAARLWFLSGEFFLFIAGWLAHQRIKRKKN